MTTPITSPTANPTGRIRVHPCRLPARTTWWASVGGTGYMRDDYPTPEAAHAAALAHLSTAGDRKDTT